jgi:hypothetical protein
MAVAMKNASSGMLQRVTLVGTDVSEERIQVTRISVLETTLGVTSNRCTLHPENMSGFLEPEISI